MKKFLAILILLLLLPFAIKIYGGDFGQARSLYSDIKANKVGDILTVLIYEQNKASSNVETKTEKSTKSSVSGGPGVGPLDFIPLFSADGANSNTFDGKGQNTRDGSLRAKMSVTVVAVKDNGDLVIEGSRTLGISNDKETLHAERSGAPKRYHARQHDRFLSDRRCRDSLQRQGSCFDRSPPRLLHPTI